MSGVYISENYKMTTNPEIHNILTYDAKREGNKLLYRFKVVTEPITDHLFFAYNLKMNITLNGKKLLTAGTIKDSTPSQWKDSIVTYFPHRTGWYEIDYVPGRTELPYTCEFYSTQTKGSASLEGRMVIVPTAVDSDIPNMKVKVNDSWNDTKKVYVKVSGVWKEAKKVYIKVNGIWKEI